MENWSPRGLKPGAHCSGFQMIQHHLRKARRREPGVGLHRFFGTWELVGAMASDRRSLFFVTLIVPVFCLFPQAAYWRMAFADPRRPV